MFSLVSLETARASHNAILNEVLRGLTTAGKCERQTAQIGQFGKYPGPKVDSKIIGRRFDRRHLPLHNHDPMHIRMDFAVTAILTGILRNCLPCGVWKDRDCGMRLSIAGGLRVRHVFNHGSRFSCVQ